MRTKWLNLEKEEAEQYEAEIAFIFDDNNANDDNEHLDVTVNETPLLSSSLINESLTMQQHTSTPERHVADYLFHQTI